VVALEVAEPGPDDAATRAGVEAVNALPESLRERVAVAAVADPGDISLTLADGTVVEWGGPEESATKADTLVALLDQIAAGSLEPAATIVVSTPDAVVLR